MWIFSLLTLRGDAIVDYESNPEVDLHKPSKRSSSTRSRIFGFICVFLAILVCLTTMFTYGLFRQNKLIFAIFGDYSDPSSRCINPPARQEWRSLSQSEKNNYISAVLCLKTKPSRVRSGGTLYDDFPFQHKLIGGYCKSCSVSAIDGRIISDWFHTNSARSSCISLLASIFLASLWNGSEWSVWLYRHSDVSNRSQACWIWGFEPKKNIRYWDWSLDWEDLAKSPVFDAQNGFGGDGNLTGEMTVGGGRCVVDGPFANLELLFFDGEYHIHCLSRGFREGNTLGRILAEKIQPTAIETILRKPDYESFFLELERGPHNKIPILIGGDFIKFTAPNDPLFFLHHRSAKTPFHQTV